MRVFFKKMGIENLRFKPAYNPYTEVRPYSFPRRRSRPDLLTFSSYTALLGDLRLPPAAEEVGRGRQQWHVPARDARAHGLPQGRARPRLGHLA